MSILALSLYVVLQTFLSLLSISCNTKVTLKPQNDVATKKLPGSLTFEESRLIYSSLRQKLTTNVLHN